MTVRCFMIEPTGIVVPYAMIHEDGQHPDHEDVLNHHATVYFTPEPEVLDERGAMANGVDWDSIDWPTHCDMCDHEFTEASWKSSGTKRKWTRPDTGQIFDSPREAGPGAMWDAHWMPSKGPDGLCLVVLLPNGVDWMVDGRANNCTRPDDSEHQCWVRHGEPPNITVDKNGNTCQAGAGSIASGTYHGFLRDGTFT